MTSFGGVDSTSTIRGRWDIDNQVFALSLSLSYDLHTVDEVQFSVGFGAIMTLSSFSCSLGANLPFYQNVGGIQLVETINGQLGCGFAL